MAREERLPLRGWVRLLAAGVVGSAVAILATTMLPIDVAGLAGLSVTHLTFVVAGWAALWPLDAWQTRQTVDREDIRPALEEFLVVFLCLGGLGGIATLIALPNDSYRNLAAGLALLGIFLAWGSLHLMYAVRYAHRYYRVGEPGGINFNEVDYQPTYRDFFYFSYNLGMTFQVSDTDVTDPEIRAITLRHCLLSYLFGAVILASTLNLVASIAAS